MSTLRARASRRHAFGSRLEGLEDRSLLSGVFTEFPLTKPGASQFVQVHDITAVDDSSVEFATTEYGASDPKTGEPSYQGTSLFQATAAGTSTPIHPEGGADRSAIYGLVKGPDGNLWGIVAYAPARLNADGSITRFPLPDGNYAQAIAAGPDGALWFTEPYHGFVANAPAGSVRQAIGRISTSGQIREYLVPANAAKPDQIAAGPDGAMWFTLNDFGAGTAAPMIGRINLSLGVVSEYAVPNAATLPHSIVTGPDGNLWFTDQGIAQGSSNPAINTGVNYIGKVTPSGTVTLFGLPPQAENQKAGFVLGGITPGPDGNVWFVEPKSGQIARITPGGTVAEFPVPTLTSAPTDITLARDGALWFTELLGDQVGRYLPGPDLSAAPATPVAVAGAGFSGVVATVSDGTPSAASTYSATVDWGDGSGAVPVALSGSGPVFGVVGGHTYARTGSYALTIAVREASGETVTTSSTMTVRGGHAGAASFYQARRSPLQIALTYDGPIDAATATNAARYAIVSLSKPNRRGVQASKKIGIRSVSFDASTQTVYLTIKGP